MFKKNMNKEDIKNEITKYEKQEEKSLEDMLAIAILEEIYEIMEQEKNMELEYIGGDVYYMAKGLIEHILEGHTHKTLTEKAYNKDKDFEYSEDFFRKVEE